MVSTGCHRRLIMMPSDVSKIPAEPSRKKTSAAIAAAAKSDERATRASASSAALNRLTNKNIKVTKPIVPALEDFTVMGGTYQSGSVRSI